MSAVTQTRNIAKQRRRRDAEGYAEKNKASDFEEKKMTNRILQVFVAVRLMLASEVASSTRE